MKKFFLWLAGLIILLSIGLTIVFNLTPLPMISLARQVLFSVPTDTRKPEYTEGSVTVLTNKSYTGKYKQSTFDLYLPDIPLPNEPTIAWVHGGGYIGGDKLEEKEYATKLAENGYYVAVMNYELVPETTYPIPVRQVGEFIKHLEANQEVYGLSMANLFIAGDSAGAQIASQFIAAQTNPAYGKQIQVEAVPTLKEIKGALLYCGPYNLIDIVEDSTSQIVSFSFDKIGWSYFAERNWENSEKAKLSVVPNYVNKDFPPTFITDGNTSSFEQQGREFASKLEEVGVPIKTRFFDSKEVETRHEYQFKLTTPPGKIAFEDTLNFLKAYQK